MFDFEFLKSLILLLVIMDPIVSLAALLSLTKQKSDFERKAIAIKGTLVAALVFFFFAFAGSMLLDVLGVSLNSFRAAGGIILILLGIQMGLGITLPKEDEDLSEIAVVIGTPLISGPATITTTILLVNDLGLLLTLAAGVTALLLVLGVLLSATRLNKMVGRGGMRVLATMMGIVTIAWGLQFLFQGTIGFFGA